MRFSCESCGAQYMISDEKVGPGGVKVRCKKCGDVIRVRGSGSAAEGAPGAAAEGATPAPGVMSVEAEAPRAEAAVAAAVAAVAPAPEDDGAVEWYVAIDDRQVGPLHGSALRKRWDSGEIGPDTLAWRAGMGDWSPVSSIPELARRLAAAPSTRGSADASSATPAPSTMAGAQNRAVGAPAHGALNGTVNGKMTTWKPTAGNALASLASQELNTAEKQPAPAAGSAPPAAADAPRSGVSLLDQVDIPEGGVDPTHLVPLPMKGLEKTTEVVLKPKTVAEHEPTQIRQLKKTAKRSGIAWGVTVASLAAIAIGAGFWFLNGTLSRPTPVAQAPAEPKPVAVAPPAAAPAPAPAAAADAAPPAVAAGSPQPAAQPAPQPSTAPAATAAAPAPAEPARAASEAPAKPAEPDAAAPAPAPEKPALSKKQRAAEARAAREAAAKEAAAKKAEARKEARRLAAAERASRTASAQAAAAAPVTAAPANAVADAPKKRASGDPLLDVAGDGDLERELSSTKPRRNVYVPPAIGADLPDNVSVSQINEAVVGQKAALLRCIEEQRAVDPNARGTLKMRWVIAGDGSTRDVRITSDEFAKQPIAPCISNVVKGIKFPRSRTTGQEVVFPFKF